VAAALTLALGALFLLACPGPDPCAVPTEPITDERVWTQECGFYLVGLDNDVIIGDGGSLRIEAGVQVFFDNL